MSTAIDVVIRNGTVHDGTGADPYQADIAIDRGVIQAIGRIEARGRTEIDAAGLLVTPGFVDIHTHYDAQATWDTRLAPSSWHGVTTALMGNCGVGFAPARSEHRQALVRLMEGVEDLPGACLHEGLNWNWESFADYLDVLADRRFDMDLCALLPHAPLRVYVMGERGLRREAATPDDIARMRELSAQAMRAGAFGFSTSRTIAHRTKDGDLTPMVRAHEDELLGIVQGMADAGHGMLEWVSDWDQPDPETEFAMLRRIVQKTGRPCVYSLGQRHERPREWRRLLDMSVQAQREGIIIRPVIAPRPIGSLFGLSGTQNPFSATPTYRSIAHLPLEERILQMRRPDIKARILAEDPFKDSEFAYFERMGKERMYERMFVLDDRLVYEPAQEHSVASMAARAGRNADELVYDLLLQNDGKDFLFSIFSGYADYNLDPTEEMLRHSVVLMGLGDGGAHVGFISDASFPTYLLTWWGRDRPKGRRSLPELIRRLTLENAQAMGLTDRGALRPGLKADINIIDFERLALEKPVVESDLPAGGKRMKQKAQGYVATLVAGQVTYQESHATQALPGRLLRQH
jgi:N-acyl-D-aspartate/D-glutamate deacylase